MNRPEEALFYNKLNLDMNPHDWDSRISWAALLKLNNQRALSEQYINEIMQSDITPSQREHLWITQTHPLLRSGATAEGIRCFLHKDPQEDRTTEFDLRGMKPWTGVAQPGLTLYVNANGGIGDQFINVRFFEHVRRLGMRPLLYNILNRPDLDQVFERCGIPVINNSFEIEPHSAWCYLMELPVLLNVKESDLWHGAYIHARPEATHVLPKTKKFRVGIKAQGNPYFEQNIYRSIPLQQMIDAIPKGCEIYLFDPHAQHDHTHNLSDQLTHWEHTLDLIDQMDLILSSCTSLVHAAGAMGKPTIVCVPILEYYIWTSTRTDHTTPWYNHHMHVLKQNKVGCWRSPLQAATHVITQYKKASRKP
jgi:hypothetical protein